MDCKLFKYKGYMKLYDEIKCQHMVNKIFSRADVDSSGAIDYTEFLVAYSEL
jgi:Ca2+-binding EF-hand superfamily protein